MKKEQIRQNNIFLFICNLFICVSTMGTFVVTEHFATDSYYAYYNLNKDLGLMDINANMRVVMGCIQIVFAYLGINYVKCQVIFGIVLIGVFAWVITRITIEFIDILDLQQETRKIILINGATLVLMLNAFLSEFLYFVGYIQWAIGILGAVYGALYIGKERKNLFSWVLGILSIAIAIGTYQIFVAYYVYIVMVIIFIRNKGLLTRKSILKVIEAAAAAILALILNLVCRDFLIKMNSLEKSGRMNLELSSMPGLILKIIQDQKLIWIDGMGIYPKYMLGIVLIVLLGVGCILIRKRRIGFKSVIFLFVVLISGQCIVYMAQIAQGFVWLAPRTIYPVFGIYSVAIWGIVFYMKDDEEKRLSQLVNISILGLLIVSNVEVNIVAVDTARTNTITKCYSQEISKRINHYEIQNGVEVTKVGFCNDAYVNYRYYGDITESSWGGNICENPFVRTWSDITSLNYYTERNFMRVEVPEDVIEKYKMLNWDEADWDEQLTFDNDAVYICVY